MSDQTSSTTDIDHAGEPSDEPVTGAVATHGPLGVENDSFVTRLSTGTGAFDILKPRRTYYIIGVVLVLASIVLILLRGFNLGIDFSGGTKLAFATSTGQTLEANAISEVVDGAIGVESSAQSVGEVSWQVTTEELGPEQIKTASDALTSAFGLTPAAGTTTPVISSAVSGTWGQEVSDQAILSVIVFLIAVALFIWMRYERRAAIASIVSTVQVMIITAGIYSLVGFELSPATVIGLLTILGFSLYDTVVVFDKVQENTRGLTSLTRRTYAEAANLAVNQTLMRSINTSLIALLPVAGLLVAGVALIGSGTLKDLALVQLVGMIVGAYSSLFVAVPLAVDLRTREPALRAHTKRVEAKRRSDGLLVDAVGDPVGHVAPVLRKVRTPARSAKVSGAPAAAEATGQTVTVTKEAPPVDPSLRPGQAPRPGARPAGARKNTRPSGKAARPTGKRGR